MSSYSSSSSSFPPAPRRSLLSLPMALVGTPQQQQFSSYLPGQLWVARANHDAGAPTTITRERADTPDVQALIEELDGAQCELHPATRTQRLGADALLQSHARLLVVRDARQQQQVVGCGAVLLLEDHAELAQMMIRPAQRHGGIGSRLVRALEQEAIRAGRPLLRLEVGVRQHDAQRLYERMGFERCGPFGAHRGNPFSVFMEKLLG